MFDWGQKKVPSSLIPWGIDFVSPFSEHRQVRHLGLVPEPVSHSSLSPGTHRSWGLLFQHDKVGDLHALGMGAVVYGQVSTVMNMYHRTLVYDDPAHKQPAYCLVFKVIGV